MEKSQFASRRVLQVESRRAPSTFVSESIWFAVLEKRKCHHGARKNAENIRYKDVIHARAVLLSFVSMNMFWRVLQNYAESRLPKHRGSRVEVSARRRPSGSSRTGLELWPRLYWMEQFQLASRRVLQLESRRTPSIVVPIWFAVLKKRNQHVTFLVWFWNVSKRQLESSKETIGICTTRQGSYPIICFDE